MTAFQDDYYNDTLNPFFCSGHTPDEVSHTFEISNGSGSSATVKVTLDWYGRTFRVDKLVTIQDPIYSPSMGIACLMGFREYEAWVELETGELINDGYEAAGFHEYSDSFGEYLHHHYDGQMSHEYAKRFALSAANARGFVGSYLRNAAIEVTQNPNTTTKGWQR